MSEQQVLTWILQGAGVAAPLCALGVAAYVKITNRLTAIETKLSNGLVAQLSHLISEGNENRERIVKLESKVYSRGK